MIGENMNTTDYCIAGLLLVVVASLFSRWRTMWWTASRLLIPFLFLFLMDYKLRKDYALQSSAIGDRHVGIYTITSIAWVISNRYLLLTKSTSLWKGINIFCFCLGFVLSCLFLMIERHANVAASSVGNYFIFLFLLFGVYVICLAIVQIHLIHRILENRKAGLREG
jgi:hypothetical protein